MIIALSGHRPNKLPNKLTGYDLNNPVNLFVRSELRKALLNEKPAKAISGMALGVDTIAAEVCIELHIP